MVVGLESYQQAAEDTLGLAVGVGTAYCFGAPLSTALPGNWKYSSICWH